MNKKNRQIKRILKQENSNHIILFDAYPEETLPEGFSFLNVGTGFFYLVHTVVVLCAYGYVQEYLKRH
jgi:hypothetical protein